MKSAALCLRTSCARREDKQFEVCGSEIYVKKKVIFWFMTIPLSAEGVTLWRRDCEYNAQQLRNL